MSTHPPGNWMAHAMGSPCEAIDRMQAEITDLRNVMSDKDMELANLQRRLRVTETNLDSVTNLLEKANGEIVVLRSENEWLLEAQNTCGSGAGCLHKEAKIDELMAENERLRAELQITTAERDIFKNAADRAISENGRLRADAERYRWLRSTTNWVTSKGERTGGEMSGGSFDYAYSRTMQFADELRNKLAEQGKDPSGQGWPNETWTTDVACKLSEIAAFANYIGALMKEAEWLYSGDTGEDTFTERVRHIEEAYGVMRLEKKP